MNPLRIVVQFCLRRAFLLVALPACISCAGPADTELHEVGYTGPQEESVTISPDHLYHILVPQDSAYTGNFPLVIALDAHGDGKMAVNKFRPAVANFPCIIAGSDLVRNNFPGYEQAISELLADVQKKYPADGQQVIISGFSGGARMAYQYALHHPTAGVLMCGAGPGENLPACPVYTISGMGDFNFAEQYVHPTLASFSDERFTSDYFHGIHEWPQPRNLEDALLILLNNTPEVNNIREIRCNELSAAADSLISNGEQIMAWKALEKAAKCTRHKKQHEKIVGRGKTLLADKEFRQKITRLEGQLKSEKQNQQTYYNYLLTKNTDWWKRELGTLKSRIKYSNNRLEEDHYLRIKGYIGILLYSLSSHLLQNDPENQQLPTILEVYAFAEPDNPDPWYFKAKYAFVTGHNDTCIKYLDIALDQGLPEQKLAADFPDAVLAELDTRRQNKPVDSR